MKSPNAGLRFAAVAAAFLMLAACPNDETSGAPSSSTATRSRPAAQKTSLPMLATASSSTPTSPRSVMKPRATLQRQAAWMELYPNLTFTVEGHADERGTREYNLALVAAAPTRRRIIS